MFHGMAEHMDRYEALVQSLTQQGYDVIRHNHLQFDNIKKYRYIKMNINFK
ncbi:serine aminopeptidase domain-containing protein [Staphylococcus aureus]|uniref:serine aminopeptidase domain-containing protein n=1 Tax=Staphylococcus aureus TaxID=1280 RepID=UPI0037DA1882